MILLKWSVSRSIRKGWGWEGLRSSSSSSSSCLSPDLLLVLLRMEVSVMLFW